MEVFRQRPKECGFYWVLANKKLYVGYIRRISNGEIGIIDGCFDFDMEDVWWGDMIAIPPDFDKADKIFGKPK